MILVTECLSNIYILAPGYQYSVSPLGVGFFYIICGVDLFTVCSRYHATGYQPGVRKVFYSGKLIPQST